MGIDITGRRVFILNPPSVIEDELIDIILAHEFEVNVLKDPGQARYVLGKFPQAIIFINIDSGLKEPEWERYVRTLQVNPKFKGIRVGILSYHPEPELVEKYLMKIGIECGFIQLRLGLQESARIMVKVLEANEAKGRRKYVRVSAEDDTRSSFNFRLNNRVYSGPILDISSVGMAFRLDNGVKIPPKTLIPDTQLKLRAAIVRVTTVTLGTRDDDKSINVVLFKHDIETKARYQIRRYIHERSQLDIDQIVGE